MGKVVNVPEGVEAWKNCNDGIVAYKTYEAGGREVVRQVQGGAVVRLTVETRIMIQESFINSKNDIFVNGTMKRVDQRVAAEVTPAPEAIVGLSTPAELVDGKSSLPEGYDAEKAVDQEDLREILNLNGAPFQAAVKKLSEGRVRRLLEYAVSEGTTATVSQTRFLGQYVVETFPHGKSSAAVLELQAELRR